MMAHSTDTIAAIATAPGEAGISIIRLSGPNTFTIADAVFECAGKKPSARDGGSFIYGNVVDGGGAVLDEAILLIMRAPNSYTKEDAVEIQAHGGSVNAKRVLRRVLEAGARMAEPGEFTKRAFLNGRLDLLQAEAVADLIHAKSERAAMAAVEQLEGHLTKKFNAIYDDILLVAANLEATLDFPDEELPPTILNGIAERLADALEKTNRLVASWGEGHFLREGASIVIAGKPNVGKSTLLNTLLGRDRAIVSAIPGTTRDVIEEGFIIDGIPTKLIDTAGLRETLCEIETEGIRRSKTELNKADVFLYLIDASCVMDEDDIKNMESLDPARRIIVLNKVDLGEKAHNEFLRNCDVVRLSLKKLEGLDALRSSISKKLLLNSSGSGQSAVVSERHRKILVDARNEALDALNILLEAKDAEMAATKLRGALEVLGQATGRTYHEELLDSIFSRFCIGK